VSFSIYARWFSLCVRACMCSKMSVSRHGRVCDLQCVRTSVQVRWDRLYAGLFGYQVGTVCVRSVEVLSRVY